MENSINGWQDTKIQIKIETLKKGLVDADIAKAVGLSPNHVSSVINGYIISNPARKKICDYLGVEYNDE